MKFLITSFLILLAIIQAGSKDIIGDEKIILQYLHQSVFGIDTSAQAIILYEKGSSFIDDGKLSLRVERIIKILSQEAADELGKISLSYDENSIIRKIAATGGG